ncbi:MAG: heat-inducible transcriptional repressor HrcA [Solirubrobacteraceae bacterium]
MPTPRQELLLRLVIEDYLDDGVPVGSKHLAESVEWGPSTVRAELAVLEDEGLLAHPHTSAGRVPTDAGYRYFVDRLLPAAPIPEGRGLALTLARREVDEAMRVTSETLSEVTDLLAMVSSPPLETSTIRHVEVLPLQPRVLMVVVITSTGGVTKRVFAFDEPVDSGLADWASSYLNERLVGLGLGARMLHGRLHDPTLGAAEQGFLDTLAPAFTALEATAGDTLYVEGAARLLAEERMQDLSEINSVMEVLERRVTLLGILRASLGERDVVVRIGSENETPALRSLALVAASYGLPQQRLGAVSVLGPVRMDYGHAIRSVREASVALSRFVEDVYET